MVHKIFTIEKKSDIGKEFSRLLGSYKDGMQFGWPQRNFRSTILLSLAALLHNPFIFCDIMFMKFAVTIVNDVVKGHALIEGYD